MKTIVTTRIVLISPDEESFLVGQNHSSLEISSLLELPGQDVRRGENEMDVILSATHEQTGILLDESQVRFVGVVEEVRMHPTPLKREIHLFSSEISPDNVQTDSTKFSLAEWCPFTSLTNKLNAYIVTSMHCVRTRYVEPVQLKITLNELSEPARSEIIGTLQILALSA